MDDQKCDVLKIATRMVKTNQDIICEQFIRNDDGALVFSDEDKKIAWKSYQEKLLNTDFAWEKNTLSQADTVSGVPCFRDRDMVRESISELKNRKAAGTLGAVSEMVKAVGEPAVDMIADLVNQIIVE